MMTAFWGSLITRYDSGVVLHFVAFSLLASALTTALIALAPPPAALACMMAIPFAAAFSFYRALYQDGEGLQGASEETPYAPSDDPASVGSDRIVIAVAALQEYKPPIILVDMGTATTMEVVDHGNTYLGGCIIPGVRVSAEALSSRASQLPGIQLDKPRRVIGKNTVECMRSGIMYGAAAMLDGMLDRMEEELGKRTTVVVTGGMAQFIAPLCRRKMMVEKDLLLKGLYAIYKKNKK